MTAFELAGKLKLDSSEFTSSLNQQESSFKSFGDKLGGLAKKAGKIAMAGLATVGAGSVMLIKSSIQEGLDFDAAMSQVAATLGKTTDEIEDLSKFARKMGSETAFSATEAAQALNYMALAGYDSETSMAMLPTVLNLAAAGNIDLARASDMVTDAQSALGLTTEETTLLVDKMAKTSSKTNTSVEQLGDAMLTVGGTAKMMKGGTTELSAVLGVLADNGIKGSEGGTALRNVLLSLATPTEDANKALSELGTNIYDAEGNMRDLPSIMADINKATEGMSDKQRANYLSRIFNKRDLKAVEALLGTSADRWKELYGEIDDAEGSAATMAKTMLENLAGDLKIFNSAVSEAKLSVSEKLTPVIRSFVQRATTWVTRLTNAFNKNGLAGAIGEAKTIVKELITESLGIGSDATWWEIGKTAATKIVEGFKTKLGEAKVRLANYLGLTDADGNAVDDPSDVTWGNVATAAFDKLQAKFKEVAGKAKVELANWLGLTDASGNAIDDPSDTSWSAVATAAFDKVKEGFSKAAGATKIKLANWLGLTDDSGNAIDDPSDTTWGNIAQAAFDKIKEKFISVSGTAKVKLANWLGLTDESGNAIDNPSDTTWDNIASKALEKIKTGFKTAIGTTKIKLANLLGVTDDSGNPVDDPSDTSWKDVASAALDKIKNGFKTAVGAVKVKLANLLGLTDENGGVVDDPSDTSWTAIATSVKTKLQEAFKNLKVSLASLLGLSADNVEGEATWEDIGRNIIEKLTSYFSHRGDFLKKLILGDEFTDESTWSDVGRRISGWLEEAFAEGGLIDAILGNTTEKATAIAEFAGNLMSGLATWISTHSGELATIVTNIITALANAVGPIAEALSAVFKDKTFQQGFSDLIVAAFEASMTVLASLFEMLGDIIGKAIFGEEWYEMKAREKERVQTETGSYKEGDQDWNTRASAIDEKYNMHVTEGTDVTGADTNAMTATMMHLGGIQMPTWWNEYKQLSNLVNLRSTASELGNLDLYEAATAGIRSFGDAWNKGLRGENLTAEVQAAFDAMKDPEVTPEVHMDEDTATKVQGYLDGIGATLHVTIVYDDPDGGYGFYDPSGAGHSFAKGLWDVPYDDYAANLHRGEMVLSASRARDYREGKGYSGSFNPSELIASVKGAIRSGMEGVSVRSYLNGKDITDEVNRNTVKQLKARRFAT